MQKKVEPVKPVAAGASAKVKVKAKLPPFIDLINNVSIGGDYQEVEMHPWLQAQVDAGLLIKE